MSAPRVGPDQLAKRSSLGPDQVAEVAPEHVAVLSPARPPLPPVPHRSRRSVSAAGRAGPDLGHTGTAGPAWLRRTRRTRTRFVSPAGRAGASGSAGPTGRSGRASSSGRAGRSGGAGPACGVGSSVAADPDRSCRSASDPAPVRLAARFSSGRAGPAGAWCLVLGSGLLTRRAWRPTKIGMQVGCPARVVTMDWPCGPMIAGTGRVGHSVAGQPPATTGHTGGADCTCPL